MMRDFVDDAYFSRSHSNTKPNQTKQEEQEEEEKIDRKLIELKICNDKKGQTKKVIVCVCARTEAVVWLPTSV